VPYLVFALHLTSSAAAGSSNSTLLEHGRMIKWGSSDLSWVGEVYPPIPSVLASLLHGTTALALVGALGAGTILEAVAERLSRRGVPLAMVAVLIALLGMTSAFVATSTENLAGVLAVALLTVGLEGYLRFVFLGHTHGGFRAGLALGTATLCSPGMTVFVLGLAAAPLLLPSMRVHDDEAGAGRAIGAVLAFPTIAGLAGWTFLCWRFAGDPLSWLHSSAPAVWDNATRMANTRHALRALALAPVFLVAVLLRGLRSGIAAGACLLLPLVAILAVAELGLPVTATGAAVLLSVFGLVCLPKSPRPWQLGVVVVTLAVQVAIGWHWLPVHHVLDLHHLTV
jgi:hypothetical protein